MLSETRMEPIEAAAVLGIPLIYLCVSAISCLALNYSTFYSKQSLSI